MAPRGRPKKNAACRTCKIRRIKCDETRPACLRCTTTGRRCDGYAAPDECITSLKLFSNSKELRSFQYFCQKASLEMTSHYDDTFWQNLVLKLSHLDSGLGHLVVAVGSLHEAMKDAAWASSGFHIDSSRISFSLQQCNKAITLLTQQKIDDSRIGVLLASCVLLVAFELIQNRLDSAVKQYQVGKRMLQSWRDSPSRRASSSVNDLIENHLSPMLDRFGKNSGFDQFETDHQDSPRSVPSNDSEQSVLKPIVLSDVGLAQSTLNTTLHYLFDCANEAKLDTARDRLHCYSQLQPILDDWNMRFRSFLNTLKGSVSESDQRRICLVRIHHLIGDMELALRIFKTHLTYDTFIDSFGTIVDLCERVVEIEAGKSYSKSKPQMSFSFDLGIVMPLSWTAWKCRDPVIRRRALHMLQTCPRREGVWLSWVAGMVASKVIEVEEEGIEVTCASDVPITNRVHLKYMHYDPCPIGTQGRKILYSPLLRFEWYRMDVHSNPSPEIVSREIQLPQTIDNNPGRRPYWVIIPEDDDMGPWNLFLAKKVFDEPSSTLGRADMLDEMHDDYEFEYDSTSSLHEGDFALRYGNPYQGTDIASYG